YQLPWRTLSIAGLRGTAYARGGTSLDAVSRHRAMPLVAPRGSAAGTEVSRRRGRLRSSGRFQLGDGLSHEVAQSGAAGLRMGDEGRPHARVPELLQVVGDAGDGFVARIGGKEVGDLVRHVDEAVGLHRAPRMRWGWVTTRTLSGRARATRVSPEPSAMRRARAVGAEMATRTGMPTAAAFCTISTLQRLVMRAKPAAASGPRPALAPISLASRLVRAPAPRPHAVCRVWG